MRGVPRSWARWLVVSTLGLGALGCGPDEASVRQWRAEGRVAELAGVVVGPADDPLPVTAAMALIGMEPVRGRPLGTVMLVEQVLPKLAPDARERLVAKLVPSIVAELGREPPKAEPGQPAPVDPSVAYKDAAYMMLAYEHWGKGYPVLGPVRQRLEQALVDWAMADFERRLNDRSQAYAMQALLRVIGARSVVGLPSLMTPQSKSLATMAELVAQLGDEATREQAAQRIVEAPRFAASAAWRAGHKPELEEANRLAGVAANHEQLEAQLSAYQDEALRRLFGSLRQLGGKTARDYCLSFALDAAQLEQRRVEALAALEGRIPRDDTASIERLGELLSSTTPDAVLNQALGRASELPRDEVIARLYALFESDRWAVRQAAGVVALGLSKVEHIDELMTQLGQRATKGFSLPEVLAYGDKLGELKDGNVRDALRPYLDVAKRPVQARLTALGYFYQHGVKDDLAALASLEADPQRIPRCEPSDDCRWHCQAPRQGEPRSATELREVTTVGEFVRYCVVPQIASGHTAAPGSAAPSPGARDATSNALPGVPGDVSLLGAPGQLGAPSQAGSAAVSSGTVANAEAVVARMRARFRHCYQEGRSSNPALAGSITLTAKIGPSGDVTSVGGSTAGPLGPIVPCLKAVVQSASFSPPEGGGAIVTIPLSFVSEM